MDRTEQLIRDAILKEINDRATLDQSGLVQGNGYSFSATATATATATAPQQAALTLEEIDRLAQLRGVLGGTGQSRFSAPQDAGNWGLTRVRQPTGLPKPPNTNTP